MDAKTTGQIVLEVTGYLPSLKEFSQKMFINYKKVISNFTEKETGRHHLNEMITVNISSNRTNRCLHFLIGCHEKDTTSFLWSFYKKCIT